MPNFWVAVSMSPPRKRRDDLAKIIAAYGGKLRENQLYSELERGKGYVLIKGPNDAVKAKAMLDAIGALEVVVTLDLDEAVDAYALRPRKKRSAAAKAKPPPAKRSGAARRAKS